ncbi:hypothetical protein R80B4_02971 [Fibrobacteres bacterium R8-0-B4]
MIFFVTVATVIIAAMLIGISRSRVNAMPVAPLVDIVDTNRVDTSSTSSLSTTPPSSPPTLPVAAKAKALPPVPSIGSVQVLNGCGAEGAANRVADFLRSKGFDVKDIGNASSWNHQSTIVISRTTDMGLADGIEKLLKTGKVVLIRNGDSMYDVTVVAGPDFEERIK